MTDNEKIALAAQAKAALENHALKEAIRLYREHLLHKMEHSELADIAARDEAHLELRCLRGIGDRLLTFLTDGAVANHNKNARKARA